MDPMLPKPIGETGNASPANTEQTANVKNIETAPNTQPEPLREGAPAVSGPPPAPALMQPISQPGGQSATSATPLIADDVDVIEKEWVEKAKKIVSATQEDPHTQEKEVSKLQADYLMKRYNKKLKVNE